MPDEESLSDVTTLGADDNAGSLANDSLSVDQASLPQGYERLAKGMAEYPSHLIFRQFGRLNAQNLLYYQAELTQLESDLREAVKLDKDSTDPCRQLYFRCYQRLSQGKVEGGGNLSTEDMEQWNLVLKIRSVLKEYNETIIALHTIRGMTRIDKQSLSTFQEWISNNGNNEHVHLSGDDHDVWWDEKLQNDLVALYAREYEDPISRWITNNALSWYHQVSQRFSRKRISTGNWMASLTMYTRKPLLRIVTGLAIGIASLIPILSIVVLNAIHDTNARLGVMALLTVVFCLLFGIFTGPKKTELLAASAAFAAVQVVFISGDVGCKPS